MHSADGTGPNPRCCCCLRSATTCVCTSFPTGQPRVPKAFPIRQRSDSRPDEGSASGTAGGLPERQGPRPSRATGGRKSAWSSASKRTHSAGRWTDSRNCHPICGAERPTMDRLLLALVAQSAKPARQTHESERRRSVSGSQVCESHPCCEIIYIVWAYNLFFTRPVSASVRRETARHGSVVTPAVHGNFPRRPGLLPGVAHLPNEFLEGRTLPGVAALQAQGTRSSLRCPYTTSGLIVGADQRIRPRARTAWPECEP